MFPGGRSLDAAVAAEAEAEAMTGTPRQQNRTSRVLKKSL